MSDKYLRDERAQLLNALGTEACWGWSPAIDFAELLSQRPPHTRTNTATTSSSSNSSNNNSSESNKKDAHATTPHAPTSDARSDASDDVFDALLRRVQARAGQASDVAGTTATTMAADDSGTHRATASTTPMTSTTANGSTDGDKERVVSVLLAGACDIRHILQTMATLRVREADDENGGNDDTNDVQATAATTTTAAAADAAASRPVRYDFYLYEPSLRVQCRHVFFLQWLCDAMFALEELEERVHMFLDVYANACTREMTAAQSRHVVAHALQTLRELQEREHGVSSAASATADEGVTRLSTLLSWRELKLRERDEVEAQLRQWQRDAASADVAAQWSRRLRQEMAERYDNRDNLIDWDYVFRLSEYAPLLRFAEYRAWRNTGVAYDVAHSNPRRGFTYDYVAANKTLCVFDRHGRGYYCGDVKCGPFYAFGVRSGNTHLHQRNADGTCKYGCSVVAMQNVRALLYALLTGRRWPWADHAFAWDDDAANYNYLPPHCRRPRDGRGGRRDDASNNNGSNNETGEEAGDVDAPHLLRARLPRVRFHLVGPEWRRLLLHVREGGVPRFDAAFVGVTCTHLLTPPFFAAAMADDGVVVAETIKFVVDAAEEAKVAFVQKLDALAAAARWRREATCTAWLHTQQPAPRQAATAAGAGASESPAAATARARYAMPYQLAFVRSCDDDNGERDTQTAPLPQRDASNATATSS